MMNNCESIWRNNQTTPRFASQFGHHGLDFTRVANSCCAHLNGKRSWNGPKRMQVDKVLGVRREYNGGPDNAGRHFFELSSIFPTSENSILVVPVRFAPGRAKLSTENLPITAIVHADRNQQRDVAHLAGPAALEHDAVEINIRV